MNEFKLKVFSGLVTGRMDEIGLQYTPEQAEQMADFVEGVVTVAQAIQKDCILSKIKEVV